MARIAFSFWENDQHIVLRLLQSIIYHEKIDSNDLKFLVKRKIVLSRD